MSNQFPHPFGEIAKNYRELRRKLPVVVSAMAVNDFQDNFTRQGYRETGGVTHWKSRKNTKDKGRGILIKSGRLKRSMRARPTFDYARVISDVPYAQIHNEGGTIKGTFSIRSFRRKTRKGFSTVRAHSRRVNTTIEARPFMITTPPLLDDIEKYVFAELDKIF